MYIYISVYKNVYAFICQQQPSKDYGFRAKPKVTKSHRIVIENCLVRN